MNNIRFYACPMCGRTSKTPICNSCHKLKIEMEKHAMTCTKEFTITLPSNVVKKLFQYKKKNRINSIEETIEAVLDCHFRRGVKVVKISYAVYNKIKKIQKSRSIDTPTHVVNLCVGKYFDMLEKRGDFE